MTEKKTDFYQLDRFTPDELMKLHINLHDYALSIGGLPQHHSEVYQKRGWLLPFLFAYDDLLWKRWSYWFEILKKGTIEGSGPIPQLVWADLASPGVQATRKMLETCLNHYDANINHFADWLLWGMAADPEIKNIDHINPDLNEYFYKKFDLFMILNYPTDYLSRLLSDQSGKGYKDSLGYFPTPFNICLAMTKMTVGDDSEANKRQVVSDPCVGCGAMLLAASNYFLKAYGMDISQIAVKLAKIQMYWYAPWFAFHPEHIQGFQDQKDFITLSNQKKVIDGQLMFSL